MPHETADVAAVVEAAISAQLAAIDQEIEQKPKGGTV
jgi:hypothetical protein